MLERIPIHVTRLSRLLIVVSAVLSGIYCYPAQDPSASPVEDLPPYLRQVTPFGQRADWSHDGKKILFLEKTFGDVYEVELASGDLRPLTHHYFHEGYVRALYLSNGDFLLSGARRFDSNNPTPSRKKNAELWVLNKDLKTPPVPLGEPCYEGPAVSRKSLKIVWTVAGDQPEGKFYEGRISYENGTPHLVDKRKILEKSPDPFTYDIETQNLRPPDENELIFSGYGEDYRTCEVMVLDLVSGKITNYSIDPNRYDEPEGIFPDGLATLVESDKHNSEGTASIDIYRLQLDGSGKAERITYFSDTPGYKASNPVVSDDGRFIAFQYAKRGDRAGVGRGILVLDLKMYGQTR
jgi:Tol biopolymer transport system component